MRVLLHGAGRAAVPVVQPGVLSALPRPAPVRWEKLLEMLAMIGCPYSPEQEHHYNVRGTCVWCGEYETRRITVPQAHLPLGLTIDRHQGRCKGRVVVSEGGGRCMGCGKRFVLGVIVKYTEARDGE